MAFGIPLLRVFFQKCFRTFLGNIVVSPGGGDISCRRREECVCVCGKGRRSSEPEWEIMGWGCWNGGAGLTEKEEEGWTMAYLSRVRSHCLTLQKLLAQCCDYLRNSLSRMRTER